MNISIEAPELDKKQYLHVYAIDNADNVSDERIIPLDEGMLTTSISTDKEEYLSDETVAVKSETKSLLYTEDGDVSISLYDNEDNFVEEVYYENGQSIYKDEPLSINTDIVLDENYEGEYTIKIEWENEDKVLCSDMATFKVKKAEDEIIEEVVNPATPTDPNPSVPESTDTKPSDTKTNPAKDLVKDQNNNVPDSNDEKKTNDSLIDNEGGSPTKPEVKTPETPDGNTEASIGETTTEHKRESVNETTTETDRKEKQNADKNAPSTGDDSLLLVLLALMFVSACVVIYIVYRKHRNCD